MVRVSPPPVPIRGFAPMLRLVPSNVRLEELPMVFAPVEKSTSPEIRGVVVPMVPEPLETAWNVGSALTPFEVRTNPVVEGEVVPIAPESSPRSTVWAFGMFG